MHVLAIAAMVIFLPIIGIAMLGDLERKVQQSPVVINNSTIWFFIIVGASGYLVYLFRHRIQEFLTPAPAPAVSPPVAPTAPVPVAPPNRMPLQPEQQPDQPPPYPIRNKLRAHLLTAILEHNYTTPPDELFQRMLDIGQAIFKDCYIPITPPGYDAYPYEAMMIYGNSVERLEAGQAHIFDAIAQSLTAFLSKLPPNEAAPFQAPITDVVNPASLIFEMIDPFRDGYLTGHDLLSDIRNRFNTNVALVDPKKPIEQNYPQDYTGPKDKIAETYFAGLPLLPLLQTIVPYQPFSETNRSAHHWCLGKTRRGKTTFLRHLIKYDLGEVAKGNCSLVVIDSKDKGLVYEMRQLQQFGPGEALDGRLILIDSDQLFPLNPFTLEDKSLARSIISYMVSNDMSALQTGALNFFVDAVLQSRNKSLETLLKYIRMKDKDKPPEFESFDNDLKDWWTDTRLGLHTATFSGVEQRLANFMRSHRGAPVLQKLRADSWGLDLYRELHNGGKVLLVDTDHLQNDAVGTALMGRLVIALIENLAARRQRAPKPIWVVIDEASDYLGKNDPSFVQILTKAAGAKVGMTVAYQIRGLIDPTIEKVLENAEIHSVCEQRGRVDLTVEERPLTLPMSRLEFLEEPKMRDEDYATMRTKMQERFKPKQKRKVEEPTDYA